MKKQQKLHPQNHRVFDPWNSSATGHQRADGPSLSHTTAWRNTRTDKLARQFAFGDCRVDNNKGSGTGEWTWIRDEDAADADTAANASAGAGAGAKHGYQDIRDFMAVTKKRKISSDDRGVHKVKRIPASTATATSTSTSTSAPEPEPVPVPVPVPKPARKLEHEPAHEPVPQHAHQQQQQQQQQQHTGSQILAGTTIYVNGSTMPLISDHKLKHLLVAHGAKLSLALARKPVTHVIIGRPAVSSGTGSAGKGAGGGLAATKLQKEIDKCGRGTKVVGVEWYNYIHSS